MVSCTVVSITANVCGALHQVVYVSLSKTASCFSSYPNKDSVYNKNEMDIVVIFYVTTPSVFKLFNSPRTFGWFHQASNTDW